jgi:AraC-like DNA-binding protein
MLFLKKNPTHQLSGIIKNFWMVDNEGATMIREEKIIPDGYPEMIFHYKETPFININGHWHKQVNYLLAGQIRNHFYLKNSGDVGTFAIKFQPSALTVLFNIDMSDLTDKVIPFNSKLIECLNPIIDIAISNHSFKEKLDLIEKWFLNFLKGKNFRESKGEQMLKLILEKQGQISLEKASDDLGISTRSLERYFEKHVGVSPKFYTRIVRFSHIFNLIQNEDFNWLDISFLAGYYDQSHFIKNFKEFTGENPTTYGFDEENMANFFLKN